MFLQEEGLVVVGGAAGAALGEAVWGRWELLGQDGVPETEERGEIACTGPEASAVLYFPSNAVGKRIC